MCERVMSEWQPIDTAPRDGTMMLVYVPGRGVWQAMWDESCRAFVEPIEEYYGYDGATHWMPLPEPPGAAPIQALMFSFGEAP